MVGNVIEFQIQILGAEMKLKSKDLKENHT